MLMKNVYSISIFLLILFSPIIFFGQGNNCNDAQPFCIGINDSFPAGVNNGTAEIGPDYGCLLTQLNPAWLYFQIENSGDLTLSINEGNSSNDIDFICWGPFTSATGGCTSALTVGNTIDCSYSANATEICNIPNGISGEIYLLMITNYSNSPCNIEISQTSGSGSTECNIVGLPTHIFDDHNLTICSDSTILDAGTYFDQYLWSTGDTTQSINISTSGLYYVTASIIDTLILTDSINVLFTQPYLNLNIGSDTLLCITDTISIIADSGFYQYLWNTGSTNQSITINQTGTYFVTTQDTANCFYHDTIKVVMNPAFMLDIGNDTAICGVATITLDASTIFDSFEWSTGDTTQTIQVDSTGIYSVTVTNNLCSQTASDTAKIFFFPLPIAEAGNDVFTCPGNTAILNGSGGVTYSWLPLQYIIDANTANPSVNPPGNMTYNMTVTNAYGCINTDSVHVFITSSAQPDLICVASVDINFNQNVIIWQMPASLSVDSVIIAKSSISTGNTWIPIAARSVNDPNIYIDNASDPSDEMASYQVADMDSCNYNFTDSIHYRHSTMHLVTVISANYIYLQWNKYYGYNYNISEYVIYRGLSLNSMTAIDTVTPNQNYFTDYAISPGNTYYYYIKAIRADTCYNGYPYASYISSFSNMDVIESSGINENSLNNDVEFYPNPVTEEIIISIPANLLPESTKLCVYDIIGNKILQSFLTKEKTELNLSSLAKGIYFLKVENEMGVAMKKFVKE